MAVSPDISFDVINGGNDASGVFNIKNTEIKIIVDTSNVQEAKFQPNLVLSDIETGETYYKSNYINIDKLMSTYQMKEDKLSQYKIEGSDTFKVNNLDSKWFNYKYSDLWNSKNNAAVWHSRFLNSGRYQTDYTNNKYSQVVDKLLLPGCYPHFTLRECIQPDMNCAVKDRIHYVKIVYNLDKLELIMYNGKNTELSRKTYERKDFPEFNNIIPTKILIALVGSGGYGGVTGFLLSGSGGGGGGTVVGILDLTAVEPNDSGNHTYYVVIGKTRDNEERGDDYKVTELRCNNASGALIARALGGGNGDAGDSPGLGGGTEASSYHGKYKYFYTICLIAGGRGGNQHSNGNRVYPRIAYCDGTALICATLNSDGTLSAPYEPTADRNKTVVNNENNCYIMLAKDGYLDSSIADSSTDAYPGLGGRSGGTSCGGGGGASAFGRGGYGAWKDGDAGTGTGPGTGGGGAAAAQNKYSNSLGQAGALYIWW